MKSNETLKVAAVKIGGQIFTGKTSVAAVKAFLWQPGDKVKKLELLRAARDGYLTSKGRFVGQQEAAALASSAGQIMLCGTLVVPPAER